MRFVIVKYCTAQRRKSEICITLPAPVPARTGRVRVDACGTPLQARAVAVSRAGLRPLASCAFPGRRAA